MTYQIVKNDICDIYADAALRNASTGSGEIIYALSDEPGSKYILTADAGSAFDNKLSESIKLVKQLGLESLAIPVDTGVSVLEAVTAVNDAAADADIQIILIAEDDHRTDLPEDVSSGIDEYLMSKMDSFEEMNFSLKDEECAEEAAHEEPVREKKSKGLGLTFLKRNSKAFKATEPCESAGRYDKPDDSESDIAMFGAAPMAMAAASCMSQSMSLADRVSHISDTWQELLFNLIDEKGYTDTEVYKKANVDRKLFSKIRSNSDYQPKKITAVAFALALELNLDEAKDFLARAGYAFSTSSVFDLIIMYFIENEVYDIYQINLALFEHDQPTIGG